MPTDNNSFTARISKVNYPFLALESCLFCFFQSSVFLTEPHECSAVLISLVRPVVGNVVLISLVPPVVGNVVLISLVPPVAGNVVLISVVPPVVGNVSHGKMTYVHCKAGRGRSTTIVLCYLVQHKGMTPAAAYDYVRLIRPRVRLASSQWQAVQDYYKVKVGKAQMSSCGENQVMRIPAPTAAHDATVFDDGSVVMVTKSDLDGYEGRHESGIVGNGIWEELSLSYRVQFAGQAALARLSCVWLRCHTRQKIGAEKLGKDSCSVEAEHRGGLGVDIPVY